MALPYKEHPLYKLRKAIIVFGFIGALLSCASFNFYEPGMFVLLIWLLAVSAIFAWLDVFFFAVKKVQHPDEDPPWPTKAWIIGDVILVSVLQFSFWAATAIITAPWYGSGSLIIFRAYGNLGALICSVLHAYCFWRQLMARYKQKWIKELRTQPCSRCGYSDVPVADGLSANEMPSNTFVYAGPSARVTRQADLTPDISDSALEEGLLIGSDFGASYGSIHQQEPVLEQRDELVVGKGKKVATKKAKAAEKSCRVT